VLGSRFLLVAPDDHGRQAEDLEVAGIAAAFRGADKVYIAPIYAAREEDDGSVSNEVLAAAIRENGVTTEALGVEDIYAALAADAKEGDLVMTMGAGDIYRIADRLVTG